MSLIHFSPFEDDLLSAALRALNQVPVGSQAGTQLAHTRTTGIPLDVKETEKEFELKADVPGVTKSDLKVQVDGDVLTLSVEQSEGKEETKEKEGVRYHRRERSSNFARRSIRMPETADLGKIHARYQDGVLLLNIQKRENLPPKQRTIAIEG